MEAAREKALSLYQSYDFEGAAASAEKLPTLSEFKVAARQASSAAVLRGKALLAPLLKQIMQCNGGKPKIPLADITKGFLEVRDVFMMAMRFDPENEEAQEEMSNLQQISQMLKPEKPPANHSEPLDVIVVGAGASGVGVGVMLTHTFGLDKQRVLLVERGAGPGETFRRWPKEMRFISPSFNQQGWTKSFDLNSVAYGTSPAFTLHAEHPTGEQYADYLCTLAKQAELNVQPDTAVTALRPFGISLDGGICDVTDGEGFEVEVSIAGAEPTVLRSRFVVWAAGEFGYPKVSDQLFPGSEHCMHNSSVRSWRELPGDDFVVIGGYESGMDAASNLASCGKRCTVVASTAYWNVVTPDPSTELAPFTAERVRVACASPTPPKLLAPLRVFAVEPIEKDVDKGSGYIVRARWGAPVEHPVPEAAEGRKLMQTGTASDSAEGTEIELRTPQRPLLCTGFQGSVVSAVAKDFFKWGRDDKEGEDMETDSNEDEKGGDGCMAGSPLLNQHDESTKTPGLFLVGPGVRHGELSFCFVYKFRQRFAVVAEAIAKELGYDTSDAVKACRDMNMFLDDFQCCQGACGDAC